MESAHEPPPEAQIFQALFGFMVTKGLAASASLDVADALKDGPLYYTQLAEKVGAHPKSLHRTLRMLTSVGIFSETAPGTFSNNAPSELLRSDHPQSLRGMAVMMTSPSHWQPWGLYEETVRSGRSGPQHAFGADFFTWVNRPENREQAEVFNSAMTSFSMLTAPLVAEGFDFSRFKRIVDIGGGHGHLLKTVLAKAPQAKGVLFDMPGVVEGSGDLGDRIERVGGDFFEAVPSGADCYIMKHIIHDWSDEHCQRLLGNVAKAMAPGGSALVVEIVMPESPGPHPAKFADVNMLAMTEGGCERTEKEFAALFQSSGLKLKAIHRTPGLVSIVEAVRA
jgi:hypothetical protein